MERSPKSWSRSLLFRSPAGQTRFSAISSPSACSNYLRNHGSIPVHSATYGGTKRGRGGCFERISTGACRAAGRETLMDYKYDYLDIKVADRVATVTIERPEYFSYEVHHEVEEIWTDLAADHDVNAIILTGAGDVFLNPKTMGMERARKPSRRNHGRHQTSNGRRIVQNFLDVEQPIIGAINGDAFSLGATLALMCDVTVASESARIADTHVKMGVVAGDGG